MHKRALIIGKISKQRRRVYGSWRRIDRGWQRMKKTVIWREEEEKERKKERKVDDKGKVII